MPPLPLKINLNPLIKVSLIRWPTFLEKGYISKPPGLGEGGIHSLEGSDSFVESYIVHPPFIGQAEQYYVGKHAMF
jgi:hypothetical protein